MDIYTIIIANIITLLLFFYLSIIIKLIGSGIKPGAYHFLKYSLELLLLIIILPFLILKIVSNNFVAKYNDIHKSSFSKRQVVAKVFRMTYLDFSDFIDYIINEVNEIEIIRQRSILKKKSKPDYRFKEICNDVIRGYLKKFRTTTKFGTPQYN